MMRVSNVLMVGALGSLLLVSPLWSLFYKGVFSWHIRQPEAWQGALEALVVWGGVSTALFCLCGRSRWVAIAAVSWLYARRHGVDAAIVINYLYLQGLIALGWPAQRWVFKGRLGSIESLLVAAFLGCVGWALVIWTGALAGFGTLRQIHLAAVVLLGAAMVLARPPQLAGVIARRMSVGSLWEVMAMSVALTLFLAMYAKASVSTDFDSIWYGLSAEKVLVSSGTILDSEGLVGPVHYYPKLFESLQLVLSGLGSIPFIVGLSIAGWGLILLAVNEALRALEVDRTVRVIAVALVASMPALAGIGITAKGDTFGAWLIVLSLLSMVRYRGSGDTTWFWLGVSAAMLAPMMRLSNIPYALTAVLLLFGLFAVRQRREGGRGSSLLRIRGVCIGAAAVLLVSLVTYRTYKLAGVLLIGPDFLVDLQARMGLGVIFPVGRLQGGALDYLPWSKALLAYLVDPRQYTGALLQWIGNVWLFMLLASVAAGVNVARWVRDAWPFVFMGLLFFPVLLCNKYFPSVGADGNYFVAPVIALTMLGAVGVSRSSISSQPRVERAFFTFLMLFAGCASLIFFVVASWGPGTRAMDANFTRPALDQQARSTKVYTDFNMAGVARYLEQMPLRTRVVGDIEGVGFWLPVRYEPMMIVGITRGGEVSSVERTIDFLNRDKVEFLVLAAGAVDAASPNLTNGYSKAMLAEAASVMRHRGVLSRAYGDDHYEVWMLMQPHGWDRGGAGAGATPSP